ncbi:MAG: 50S ribosomal protein L13 [Lentisphaerae bacterium]|nr:50S ribosomal protein L13 [Lentisphaerota bacterium]
MKTTIPKASAVTHAWKLVDAAGLPAGRLAVVLANMLRGKDRPDYTPHTCTGDMIVVINAAKVRLTGNKEEQKIYKDFTGYPSGLKQRAASVIRAKDPARIIRQAVHGMLPDNHTRAVLLRRLKVFAGPDHDHAAQKPEPCAVKI